MDLKVPLADCGEVDAMRRALPKPATVLSNNQVERLTQRTNGSTCKRFITAEQV
jgi:hypothetical protein